jgi:hypothetical protein
MMRVLLGILLGVSCLCGCSRNAHELTFTGRADLDNQTLRDYVPVGTPARKAETLMTRAGFSCEMLRNQDATLVKGATPVGEIKNQTFLRCAKSENSRQWNVILLLDAKDRVRDVSVTSHR